MAADPWDLWRRMIRDDPFLSSMFKDLDKEMDRMREVMQRFAQQAEKGRPGEPMVFGFSMRVGPDGRPRFEEFGTSPAGPLAQGVREPLVDVIETDKLVTVTAELPGVEKDAVQIRAQRDKLTVRAVGDGRRYEKTVMLPVAVRPDTAKATFNNGVLDVEIERENPAADEGHEVKLQ